jgi:hypothetical protein
MYDILTERCLKLWVLFYRFYCVSNYQYYLKIFFNPYKRLKTTNTVWLTISQTKCHEWWDLLKVPKVVDIRAATSSDMHVVLRGTNGLQTQLSADYAILHHGVVPIQPQVTPRCDLGGVFTKLKQRNENTKFLPWLAIESDWLYHLSYWIFPQLVWPDYRLRILTGRLSIDFFL